MEYNLADLYESIADVVPDNMALSTGDVRRTYAEPVSYTHLTLPTTPY